MPARSMPHDSALRSRAAAVIPGGMYGHMNAQRLPADFPQFFSSAQGCRVTDSDGNTYLDFMCSFGPIILGHRDPVVEGAVSAQLAEGDCFNGPSETLVDLAELLVDTIAAADWAVLGKNGTDATTLCLTIARAATGRRKVLAAHGSYHGAAPWCTPNPTGTTAADRANLGYFDYNDLSSVEDAVAQSPDDIAAIIVTPFKHDLGKDQELPDPAFARGLRQLCDRIGAVLILDDVRCGFRLDLAGSWEPLGVRPDLSAWSKAIANGYPLAAVTGIDALRETVTSVFATGSFWFSAASMRAAVATITELQSLQAPSLLTKVGQQWRSGLAAQASSHDLVIRQTGPVQMPFLAFAADERFERAKLWTTTCLRGGAYIHPYHNGFLSTAHTEADIDEALQATDRAFDAVIAQFGRD